MLADVSDPRARPRGSGGRSPQNMEAVASPGFCGSAALPVLTSVHDLAGPVQCPCGRTRPSARHGAKLLGRCWSRGTWRASGEVASEEERGKAGNEGEQEGRQGPPSAAGPFRRDRGAAEDRDDRRRRRRARRPPRRRPRSRLAKQKVRRHGARRARAASGSPTRAARHRRVARPEAAGDLGLRVLRQEPPPARLRQPLEGAPHHDQGGRRQLARRLRGGRHPPRAARSRSTTSRSRPGSTDAELTKGEGRFVVVVQDNGPGIVKAQVPKIFGKLLYGSKFHRLKQARGQQGIGISAAAMYGQLTTGKPIRVTSRVGKSKAAHVFDIQIDTRKNEPVVTHDETARGVAPGARDAGRARDRRQLAAGPALRQPLRRAHRAREPARHDPLHPARRRGPAHERRPAGQRDADLPAGHDRAAQGGARDQAASPRRRAGRAHADGAGVEEPRRPRLPADGLQPRLGRRPPSEILAKVPWGKKAVRPRVLGENRAHGGGAAQGHRRDQAHEPARRTA